MTNRGATRGRFNEGIDFVVFLTELERRKFLEFPLALFSDGRRKSGRNAIIRKIVLSSLERVKFEAHFDN